MLPSSNSDNYATVREYIMGNLPSIFYIYNSKLAMCHMLEAGRPTPTPTPPPPTPPKKKKKKDWPVGRVAAPLPPVCFPPICYGKVEAGADSTPPTCFSLFLSLFNLWLNIYNQNFIDITRVHVHHFITW
jgi:hypothetical protein